MYWGLLSCEWKRHWVNKVETILTTFKVQFTSGTGASFPLLLMNAVIASNVRSPLYSITYTQIRYLSIHNNTLYFYYYSTNHVQTYANNQHWIIFQYKEWQIVFLWVKVSTINWYIFEIVMIIVMRL